MQLHQLLIYSPPRPYRQTANRLEMRLCLIGSPISFRVDGPHVFAESISIRRKHHTPFAFWFRVYVHG